MGDTELHLQGYNLFRNDRKSGVGGGVVLYIHKDLAAVPCKVLNDVGFDNSLWYTIPLSNNDKLLVGVLWAPSSSIDNNQRLLSIMSNLHETVSFSHLLIMGDFNLPSINWAELVCSSGESSLASLFLDAVQDSYLVQHVTNCTRHRQGQQSSLLDLILSSDPNRLLMKLSIYHLWEVVTMTVFCGIISLMTNNLLQNLIFPCLYIEKVTIKQ